MALLTPGGSGEKLAVHRSKIIAILKEADAGALLKDICRKHGISKATYYK